VANTNIGSEGGDNYHGHGDDIFFCNLCATQPYVVVCPVVVVVFEGEGLTHLTFWDVALALFLGSFLGYFWGFGVLSYFLTHPTDHGT
jgi:hypothetical protein